jgi:3-oxoadipate enol-lactonase
VTSDLSLQPIPLREAQSRLRWEAEQGQLDLGRYKPAYVRWGQGPPLVFLHGLGGSWPTFLPLLAILSREFECIGYNQPSGKGDRAWLRQYRHEHLVEDLVRVLDCFGLKSASLVAHSFGTSIALAAIHRYPERFQRAVLIGGFVRRKLRPRERLLATLGRYLPGSLALMPGRVRLMKQAHGAAFADGDPQLYRLFLQHTGMPRCRTMAHWAFVLDELDLAPILPQVRRPVLVVGGQADPLTPPSMQRELFESLPQAALLMLERCGHFPMYCHPEVLAEAICRFARVPPCASPSLPALGLLPPTGAGPSRPTCPDGHAERFPGRVPLAVASAPGPRSGSAAAEGTDHLGDRADPQQV